MKVKYIPEEELVDGTYYYVHNFYQGARDTVSIKKWLLHDWVCDGLGSGGKWLAIAEVPEIDISKYEVQDD